MKSRGSSISRMTRLRLGRPGLDSRQGHGFLLFTTASRLALDPTQPIVWVPGTLPQG